VPRNFIRRKLLNISENHHDAVLGGKLQEASFNELPDFRFRMALLGVVLPSPHLARAKIPIFLVVTLIQAFNVPPASQL
jgi:hypothetical protein